MAKLTLRSKAIVAHVERQVHRAVLEAAVNFERILQEEFRRPKTGRVYGAKSQVSFDARSKRTAKFVANRGKKWREGKRNAGMHRASAPGEAPAIRTGALRKGIVRVIEKIGPMRYVAKIGVSIQSGRGGPTTSGRSIAEMLEYGTEHMKPRPGFRIALEKFKAGYRVVAKKRARKPAVTKG